MATHDRGNTRPDGRFERTTDTAERDAEAARLRAQGWTYQQIADTLGYEHRAGAYKAVQRALRDTVEEPADELRRLELARLDRMWRAAEAVLEAQHYAVSAGRVVRRKVPVLDSTGQPVLDPETGEPMHTYEDVHDAKPVIDALAQMLKIQERRARLLGLDAPAKSRVEVITTDQITAEIQRLEAEIAAREKELASGDL